MTTRQRVLITGTTSGLGLALLEHYVGCGAWVVAVNRRRVPTLEARYPSVRFECVDVRSAQQVEQLVESFAHSAALPDVFLLNAGINRVDNDAAFQLDAWREVIDTNLYGVLNFVQPLSRLPAGKEPRHVVAIGSMASYVGNPYGLGYHVSKRALAACFDVWSRMYAGTDLVFQHVVLGPVHTQIYTMADAFPTWMVRLRDAFSAPMDGAVAAIARFATTRKATLHYPPRAVPLYLGMWLSRALVPTLFHGRRTLSGAPRRRATSDPPRASAEREPEG